MSPINFMRIACSALLYFQLIPLHAEDFYYGGSVGYSNLNESVPAFDTSAIASSITLPEGLVLIGQPTVTIGYDIDDDRDVNWRLFGGYNLSRYFGVEAGYINFGESKISRNISAELTTSLPDPLTGVQSSDAEIVSSITVESNAFHVNAIARYPFMDKFNASTFSLYAKAGAIWWNSNVRINSSVTPFSLQTAGPPDPFAGQQFSTRSSAKDDGINFSFGVGADYHVTLDIGVRAEWGYYRSVDDRNVSSVSLGLFYLFGL